ncbi:MAG: recombination mediator RecR [Bacteroidales bacterium]
MKEFPSRLIEQTVEELSRFPGIGKRTALRLSLWLLKQEIQTCDSIGNAIIKLRRETQYCKKCHNISDKELCEICANPSRDEHQICVVEDCRDIIAIENTSQFKGLYHVLGGIINPMEGMGPSDINYLSLETRIKETNTKEIIFALPPTIEGDTTCFFLYKKLKQFKTNITTIARGISIGNEIEYTDEITLGRSISNRIPYSEKSK